MVKNKKVEEEAVAPAEDIISDTSIESEEMISAEPVELTALIEDGVPEIADIKRDYVMDLMKDKLFADRLLATALEGEYKRHEHPICDGIFIKYTDGEKEVYNHVNIKESAMRRLRAIYDKHVYAFDPDMTPIEMDRRFLRALKMLPQVNINVKIGIPIVSFKR